MVRDWRHDASIRRLGERRSLPEQIPAFVVRSRKSLFKKGPERIPVHVDNVSVTGVGFFAATALPMQVSDLVMFEIAGTSTQMRIRRVTESGGTAWTYYGAQFIDPQQTVMMAIERVFFGERLPNRDVAWHEGTVR
jgi:hypothetical protein